MTPELLAAIAAIAAAALSLVSLVASGRRERRRDDKLWVRSNLLEASIEFLDSSWLTRQHARFAFERRTSAPEWLADLRSECWHLNGIKGKCLTKIRLLGPEELVTAAQRLCDADNRMVAIAFSDDREPSSDEWKLVRAESKRELSATLDAFRKTLNLGPGAPLWGGDGSAPRHDPPSLELWRTDPGRLLE